MHDLRQLHSIYIYLTSSHGIPVKKDLISTSCFQITVEKMYPKVHVKKATDIQEKNVNVSSFIYIFSFFHFHFGVFYNVDWRKYN